MKTTIKLLFTIVLLMAIGNVQAQSHDMSPGSTCKLIKTKVNSESHICPACAAKDKKEKEAISAENKRRDDAIVAKAKAENDARQAAFKEEQRLKQEQYKKERAEKVVINLPKNPVDTKKNVESKKDKNVTDNTIMNGQPSYYNVYGRGEPCKFVNEKGETIIENMEWFSTSSLCGYDPYNLSISKNCPKNLGIVAFRDKVWYKHRMDLVNSKGKYLFNDNNIRSIIYLNDGWLFIDAYPVETYVYNLNTKKKVILNNLLREADYEFSTGLTFPSIYADVDNVFKKNLYSTFKSQINDDILRKYSFTLIHSNRFIDQFTTFRNDVKVVLYCVTKNGELTKIDLK